MELTAYDEGLLPALTQLVNDHIRLVPPGWTLTPEQVAYVLSKPNAAWTAHFPENGDFPDVHTLCVLDNQQLVAAAQWCFIAGNDDRAKTCMMPWVVALSEHRAALDLLFGVFVGQAVSGQCASIRVCPRYGFGVGWFGVPTLWPHLIEAMQRYGFDLEDKWVIMTADIGGGKVKVIQQQTDDLRLSWEIDEKRLEWRLEAKIGDVIAGECQAWGVPTHFRGCTGYEEWMTIEWLGVEDAFQRRGFGRRLLQEQMVFHAKRGVKKIALWVTPDNSAAIRLYQSMGFVYNPECWSFIKVLS